MHTPPRPQWGILFEFLAWGVFSDEITVFCLFLLRGFGVLTPHPKKMLSLQEWLVDLTTL